MRWLRGLNVLLATAVLGTATLAGAQVNDPALTVLDHGRLVLWIVQPAPKTWSPEGAATSTAVGPQAIPKEIHEVTAGSFGANASDVGHNAGSYGQAASTLGSNASDVGTASSNYGQTAGSFGTEASNVGTSAGNYGQAASTYGQTASTYGESISGVSNATGTVVRPAQTTVQARFLHHQHLQVWDGVTGSLKGEFPGLDLVVYDVHEEELSDALRLAAGTQDAPDALLGAPLPWKWARLSGGAKTRLVVTAFGTKEGVARRFNWGPEWVITAEAPHPDRARAFSLWMSDGNVCASCGQTAPDPTGAGVVALRAVNAVIQGGTVDGADADQDMARASSAKVRATILGDGGIGADKVLVDAAVTDILGNDHFAAVAVRAMVSTPRVRTGPSAFGVVHALVLLRRETAAAKWHVLQISPEMSGTSLTGAMGMIEDSVQFGAAAKVLGVSLAAPEDGDTRSIHPDLWWDNKGGAALELVEWQEGPAKSWSGSRLVFLPDRTGEVKTRITADFAVNAVAYRWRVWSVGDDGSVALSPWRTMNIVP